MEAGTALTAKVCTVQCLWAAASAARLCDGPTRAASGDWAVLPVLALSVTTEAAAPNPLVALLLITCYLDSDLGLTK